MCLCPVYQSANTLLLRDFGVVLVITLKKNNNKGKKALNVKHIAIVVLE